MEGNSSNMDVGETWKELDQLNITNLDDDALIHIFKYLDRKSHLKLMLVCRRFEQLIGQDAPEFYGTFKLAMSGILYVNKDSVDLLNIRRRFGIVKLGPKIYEEPDPEKSDKNVLIEVFGKIGQTIKKLELYYCCGTMNYFVNLMLLVPNVKELEIWNISFKTDPKNMKVVPDVSGIFLQLKNLVIHSITAPKTFVKVLKSIDTLNKVIFNDASRAWQAFQSILVKQKKLKTLSITNGKIEYFEHSSDWGSIKIENLNISQLTFSRKSAFDEFVKFVQLQTNVKKLTLDIFSDEKKNGNDYSEILNHLLNLESLTSLNITYADCRKLFGKLSINNPTVKTLEIGDIRFVNFAYFFKYFPKIQKAEFHNREHCRFMNVDFNALKMLDSLTELTIHFACESNLKHIQSPHLEKFIAGTIRPANLKRPIWSKFAKMNPEVKYLKLRTGRGTGEILESKQNMIRSCFRNLQHLDCAEGL
jgi:hypothetical protein